MPALRNVRHEAFVQQLVLGSKNGWTQGACYSRAGYRAEGGVAEAAACRLLKDVNVRARLAELAEPAVRRTKVTIEKLMLDLDTALTGATEAKQFGAVNGAVALMGKLSGLLRDKLEIGPPGSFDNCETPSDIVDRLLAEFGGKEDALDALDQFRALILQRASSQPTVIEHQPQAARAGAETALALELLRPTRRT
jgi:hypothetical protein